MKRLCVFCGSRPGNDPAFAEAARTLADALVARGVGLVYGGAQRGLMGVLADRVLQRGGHVTGVIPAHMIDKEIAHRGVQELRVVQSMHERKAVMAERADAFLALPGGFGTLEELMEVITWGQLGLHDKPCGLLNVADYYDAFLSFADHMRDTGFAQAEQRADLMVEREVGPLLDRLLGENG